MKYLLKSLKFLEEPVRERRLFVFLDYDGTLTPIVRRPHAAVLPPASRGLLTTLSRQPDCQVAIMSGRILKDVKKRVKLKGVIYSGNHGLEIQGPQIRFRLPLPSSYRRTLKKIKKKLLNGLRPIRGILIEDKGLTLAVHYRMVKNSQQIIVKKIFDETTLPEQQRNVIRCGKGKKVFEIKPPVNWDKGKAVLWLLCRHNRLVPKALPVFVGDDTTDEDVFRALKGKGVTVYVGRGHSRFSADYYLNNSSETLRFLRWLIKTRTHV